MTERARILAATIATVLAVAVCVGAAVILVLHRVSLEQHRARLAQVVQHRARILEEVAASPSPSSPEHRSEGIESPQLSELFETFARFGTFGETGELTVARREGDRIVWLVANRHAQAERSRPTSRYSELAEPMRRALAGESGSLVGRDDHGEEVLAAYTSVPRLGWGIVAKIDVAEIDRPFAGAALLSAAIAIAVTALGVGVMFRVSAPWIGQLETRVAERTAKLTQVVAAQKRLEQDLRHAASRAALAEERERRKLAVDLHDGLGQLLTVSGMRLALLRDSIDDAAAASEIQAIADIIAEADELVSSLSFELSPPLLHDVGLVAAAHWLAETAESRFGLHVTVEDDGERWPLEEATRTTLFRGLRELLLNLSKHARTDKAHIRFWAEDGFVKVAVEDAGVGFDPDADTKRYGLLSIREQLGHLGGNMQIESARGKGTRVCMAAPMRAKDPETTGEAL